MSIDDKLQEKWLPLFRAGYGDDAIIEKVECASAGINGITYRVFVKNQEGKKGEHFVRHLLGSDEPVMIDGLLTKAGKNYVDFWSDYGEFIGGAY